MQELSFKINFFLDKDFRAKVNFDADAEAKASARIIGYATPSNTFNYQYSALLAL